MCVHIICMYASDMRQYNNIGDVTIAPCDFSEKEQGVGL